MKIGICSTINPYELREFLPSDKEIPSINGGASAINTYVKELLRQGHHVIVFTSAVPSNETKNIILKGDMLEIHIIHSTPGFFITHALSRLYMVRRLRNYMRPYISELDVLHAQWTYDFALAAKSFECDIPVFCTVRDWCPYITSLQRGLKKIQWRIYGIIFKRVMSSNRIHFIANSQYTYNQIKSMYPQKHIDVIYNPIDKNYILEKKKKFLEDVYISISSTLTEGRKNIKKLLEAFQLVRKDKPEAQLKLVGRGLEEGSPTYIDYFNKGLLTGVTVLGPLAHSKLIEAIDESSCLVHPSLEETFGNILIEGMARCVPVIGGANSGAVPQVLENGMCGILCDIENVNELAAAMLLASKMENTDSIVSNATNVLKTKYSSESIVKDHLHLYRMYAL